MPAFAIGGEAWRPYFSKAKSLSVDGAGIKLVFSGQKDGPAGEGPLSSRTRWQPVFIAETNEKKVYRVTDLDPRLFLGNPVMPVFYRSSRSFR